jgi:hypothetical protein
MTIDLDDYFDRLNGQKKRFEGLNVWFTYEHLKDEKETLIQGRPIHTEVLKLNVQPVGGDHTVRDLEERDKFEYKDQYEAFMKMEAAPATGTHLKEWTLISRSNIEELKHFGIKTVEDLSEFPINTEDQRQHFIEKWQKRARDYLEAAKGSKNKVVALTEINEKLEAKVAKYEQQVLLLLQRIESSEGVRLTNGINGLNI